MSTLCRKCGESLLEFSFCIRCKESIQRICSVCRKITDERFHQQCIHQLYILKLFPIPSDKAFDRPKILPNILLGNSYRIIIESLEEKIKEFESREPINEFLTKLVRTYPK